MVRAAQDRAASASELVDEAFLQLVRHSRGNPDASSVSRVWELLAMLCAVASPSDALQQCVVEYVQGVSGDPSPALQGVSLAAARTFQMLKRSCAALPRQSPPSADEVLAFLSGRHLSCVVYFVDGTFEEVQFSMGTTVKDALKQVANSTGLATHQTFGLYLVRAHAAGRDGDAGGPTELSRLLDDAARFADYVPEAGSRQGGAPKPPAKLEVRKRVFRDTDGEVDCPRFLALTYVQAQREYARGEFNADRDDAVALCAYQMVAGGQSGPLTEEACQEYCSRYINGSLQGSKLFDSASGTYREVTWAGEVLRAYDAARAEMSQDDARAAFLKRVRELPYGNAVFFTHVLRHTDPIGLLPENMMLGVNKNGLHFFRNKPREFVQTIQLRDIMQFGSSSSAVFFKMRMAGELKLFQFTTKEGEEICQSLQTHIHEVLAERKGGAAAAPAPAGPRGASAAGTAAALQLQQYQEEVRQARRAKDAAEEELRRAKDALSRTEAALQDAGEELGAAQQREAQLAAEADQGAERAARLEREVAALEERLAGATAERERAREDAAVVSVQQVEEAERSLAKARADLEDERGRAALLERQVEEAEQRARDLRAKMSKREEEWRGEAARELEELERRNAGARAELEAERAERNAAEMEVARLAGALEELQAQMAAQEGAQAEVEELRQFRDDHARKLVETEKVMRKQGERLMELEALYKQEMGLRKRYWNAMEDMKGKIRVYARVRPMLGLESSKGQQAVLESPDEYSLSHPWKDDKARVYDFDRVFSPSDTQDQVFEDTKHLVQSAVDGYNVCIFAYGQTGSGKTHTIYGSEGEPGLCPRGVDELFRIVDRDRGKFMLDISVTMLELYQDTLLDLLLAPPPRAKTPAEERYFVPPKLEIKKDSKGFVTVQGATVKEVASAAELMAIIERGVAQRNVSETKMNRASSRSHLVISVVIEATNLQTQSVTRGKLSFVDLAGSERLKKSGSEGQQQKEAMSINKSLSALGDVISALAVEAAHVPYRNHKLTMLMSDSLGGNAKTLMFCNVSPADGNLDETQNSLQYATRVRTIKNSVSKNESTKEVARLKKTVDYWKGQAGIPPQARDWTDLMEIEEAVGGSPMPDGSTAVGEDGPHAAGEPALSSLNTNTPGSSSAGTRAPSMKRSTSVRPKTPPA